MSVEPEPPAARGLLSAEAPPAFYADTLARAGVRHGFFGRRGGVSEGIYASLNAGPGSRDDQSAIAENRRRIAGAFGLGADKLVSLHQVHSPRAVFVDAPFPGARPEADALVTTTPGLVLSALSADCGPVLFADPQARVIASAHAGWRGALSGVLEASVAAMVEAGARQSRIIAAIGPCIHQASYEVGPEFESEFLAGDSACARFFIPGAGDRRKFDLPGFCAARLEKLRLASVEILPCDTYSGAETLFSHRRGVHEGAPDYGRNCAAIAL
jgi:YfiH family protein